MVTIDFKLADIKLESSETYLLKLGKNLSKEFKIIYTFAKCDFKYMPISLTFLDLQDIFGLKNAIQKHNHHLHIGLDHLK